MTHLTVLINEIRKHKKLPDTSFHRISDISSLLNRFNIVIQINNDEHGQYIRRYFNSLEFKSNEVNRYRFQYDPTLKYFGFVDSSFGAYNQAFIDTYDVIVINIPQEFIDAHQKLSDVKLLEALDKNLFLYLYSNSHFQDKPFHTLTKQDLIELYTIIVDLNQQILKNL